MQKLEAALQREEALYADAAREHADGRRAEQASPAEDSARELRSCGVFSRRCVDFGSKICEWFLWGFDSV